MIGPPYLGFFYKLYLWIMRFYFYLAVYKSQQGEFKEKENNIKQTRLIIKLKMSKAQIMILNYLNLF